MSKHSVINFEQKFSDFGIVDDGSCSLDMV